MILMRFARYESMRFWDILIWVMTRILEDVALWSWLGLKSVGRRCSGEWLLLEGCVGRKKKKGNKKRICCLYTPGSVTVNGLMGFI